jgi:acylphosphatase
MAGPQRETGSTQRQARLYFIQGRVQGVGYRYWAQLHARRIGIRGYARNLDDGRVEVYAIGTPEQLSEYAGHLWQGPPFSDVRSVEAREAAVVKYDGFQITG